jgi:hypothetical protein
MKHGTRRTTLLLALPVAASLLAGAPAGAQSCNALTPSGGDDAPVINNCLATAGVANLGVGTFLIYQPIQAINLPFPVTLSGVSRTDTKIYPQFVCGDPRFVANGSFLVPVEIRRTPGSVIRNFHLDLDQLRMDCGHGGNWALTINKSGGSTVSGLKITGSEYGQPDYTTGWTRGGGILVVNSANTQVLNNVIKNVGYRGTSTSPSSGFSGIQIDNSGSTRVEGNEVRKVAFGIEVTNKSPTAGYTGDSSGTVVNGNLVNGAALIGCPDCAHGRGIKFQACGVGDELPTRNVVVTNNTVSNFGGQSGGVHARQGGSGLHLTCGVQYSRFENNSFIGAPTAEMGVLIDSSFNSPPNPTHHNTFNYNTFYSGRGDTGCNSNCADVEFNDGGPDQIGLSRASRGTNTLKPVSSGYAIRNRCSSSSPNGCTCNQYSHAWFVYPFGQTFINRGQYLTVAGAGIRPPEFFSVITFRFRNQSGAEVATYTTQRTNSNCVVNQESFYVNPATFAPGLYTVYAQYYDGNAPETYISNDLVGTLDVR